MNSPVAQTEPDGLTFDRDFASAIARPVDPIGPTGKPDAAFGVRLLGASENHTAADCVKPSGSGNPGWLMTLVDLLLARGALRPGSPHSCVTLRMDLNVNAAAFATATHIRGLARHSFADDNLTMGTCELRADDDVLLATGMGMFVSIDAPLPLPFIPTEPHTDSTSLTELLEFIPDATGTTVTWPIRDWTANPSGVVHGGVQAAALFAAIENLAAVDAGAPVAFGNCSVEYLRPLPADGAALTIGVTATRRGRQFATYDAQLYAADGRVGTKATATLRLSAT